MSDDESARREELVPITARICQEVASATDEALRAAVIATNGHLGVAHNEHGVALTYVPLAEHFADVGKLRDALARHTLDARSTAVWLLAKIDPRALLPHWRELVRLSKGGFYAMSWAGAVAQAASGVWYTMAPLLAPEELGEMFLRGEIALRGVPDDVLARISLTRILASIRDRTLADLNHDDALRLAGHPELSSVDDRTRVVGELLAMPTSAILRYALIVLLLSLLGASGDERALPILLQASVDADERYRGSADSALIAMRHPPSLERIARGVTEAAARGDLKWDPHHVAPGLQRPIQAVFAIDPSTATERFAPYLTDAALEKESNAKLVRDVLSIGRGVLVAHRDVRLSSHNPSWLEEDPRWRDVCARLATHALLGPTVWPLLRGWKMPVPAPPKKKKARAGKTSAKKKASAKKK